MKILIRSLFALTLIAVAAASVSAQQVMRRVEEPAPLDASDPLAIRAAAVVKPILAAERAVAIEMLRKEAEASYAAGGALEKDVDAQIKRLGAGKYKIDSYEVGFGADVVVFLKNDEGDDANIVVRYNGDRKMTGFAEAKIQRN